MIAHIAEAAERSGRVILWLDPGQPLANGIFPAAARLAAGFKSEIETAVAAGQRSVPFDGSGVPRGFAPFHAAGQEQAGRTETPYDIAAAGIGKAGRAARSHGVAIRHGAGPRLGIDALADMCRRQGPWNVIALARKPTGTTGSEIAEIFANVSGVTGILVAGDGTKPDSGPVVIVAEDCDRLASLMRAARRINSKTQKITVVVAAPSRRELTDLEGAIRLSLAERDMPLFDICLTYGVDGALDETIRRLQPSYVIAKFGGAIGSRGRQLSRVIEVSGAPFLLVR